MGKVDPNELANSLAARFRIALTGEVRQIGDNEAACIRAADLVAPNGFVVQVTTGWRSVDAEFVPDTFAGGLIRSMGGASPAARLQFTQAAQAFSDAGMRLTVNVNQASVPDLGALPPAPWSRFDLKVHRMTAAGTIGQDAVVKDAGEVAATCFALVLALLPLEESHAESAPLFEGGLPEGALTRVVVNRYERNPVNRAACIAKYGAVCSACGFNFGTTYGVLGSGYIEVHHLIPVSQMGAGYAVDPIRDLAPLCANCHAMVHRDDPPLSLETLRELLKHQRTS